MKEENTYNEIGGSNLPDYLRVNPFGVPDSYFDRLENDILGQIAEQKLKEQVSSTGFTVPPHYFVEFEGHVQAKLSEQKLKDKAPTDGYQVPEAYFEELADKIKSSLALEQLAKSEEGFEVPAGYFETLSSTIIGRVTETAVHRADSEVHTPVVRMPAKGKWWRYASAAAVTLLVGIGAYWFTNDTTPQQPADGGLQAQASLHEISNEEIVHYLAQVTEGVELIELATYMDEGNVLDTSYEINEKLNNKEIEEYLNYML